MCPNLITLLRLGNLDKPLHERLGDYGDVTERKEIRKSLQCK